MSRYQTPRDRFGRPLNPDRRQDGPGFNQSPNRNPQPGRGPMPGGPQQPNPGPRNPDSSGRPPQRPSGPGRPDGFDRGPQRPNESFGNGGRDQNGGSDRGQRHPFNRFARGNDRRGFRGNRHRHGWRGRHPQGQHRNEPPPIPKDQLTNDADAFWRAGRDLDLLTDTSQPTPGITLRRLGPSPFGEHAAAVELSLRRTWSASTAAAAALLRR